MRGAWRAIVWCAGGAAALGATLLACVLADPPPIQQLPAESRPVIINTGVTPPLGVVIGAQPSDTEGMAFSVPVQIDPDQALQWRVFVDFATAATPSLDSQFDAGPGGNGTTTVTFTLFGGDLGDPTQCHTIELDVASNGWVPLSQGPSNVPVDPPGGDRVVWNYEPTGNCVFYDAGPFPEAGE